MRLPGILGGHQLTNDDWYTPPEIFETLAVTFDLDPCAPPGGVPWIPATRHYTEEDDGLAQPWDGTIWLNPPYSKPGPWLNRMMDEQTEGIALVPADSSTRWWQNAAEQADAVCMMARRVQFIQPDNQNVTSGRFPSCMFAIGAHFVTALRRSHLGMVFE